MLWARWSIRDPQVALAFETTKKKKVSKENPDKITKHWFSRPCMLRKEGQSSLRDGGSCDGPALPRASGPRSSKDGCWCLPEWRRQNSESKDKTKEAGQSVASRDCRENADRLRGPLESPVRKLGARNKRPERTRRDRVLSLHRSNQPDWKTSNSCTLGRTQKGLASGAENNSS